VLTLSRTYVRAGALAAIATLATACTSSSTHARTSTSTPAASSAAVSPGTSTAGTPSAAAPASSAPGSPSAASSATSVASSNAAASAAPVGTPHVVVELARSHRTGANDIASIDVDEVTVVGLADNAAISAALQRPATTALADYTKFAASGGPCTVPACASGDFQATFTTSRADSVVVSGTWTISTFYPGGAHPSTQLVAVIVDATSGASIAPSQLFVGSSLKALAALTATAATTKLDAIGCNVDQDQAELADGVAARSDNYAGTAIGRTGLLIGISQGQVAAEACGTLDLAVPWTAVQSQLSRIGARFAAIPPPIASALIGAGAPTAASANAPRCATTSLDVALGTAKQVVNTQYQVPIVFTNVSAQPCFLLGFPGTDFGAAGALPMSLVRTPAKPARINLVPGHQAHAVLTYLSGPDPTCDAGGPWTPSTLTVTPPDDTTSVQIPWPGGSVDDCQTGATHPGSYVGPAIAG
jgi:hypothetical protein